MPHLKALTSVRAFAAYYVGVFHMVRPYSQWGRGATFVSAGYTGVSFFFFLSGFILLYTHGLEYAAGKGDRVRFWMARFARVYPLYFVVMVWAGWASRMQFHPLFHVVAYVADFLMLQSWSVRMVPFFNVVAWSLSVEAFYYFVFPWVAPRMRPSSLKRGLGWLAGSYALALLPALVALAVDAPAAWTEYPNVSGPHWIVYALRRYPVLLLGQFLCGIALGWIYLDRGVSERFARWSLAAGVAGLVATLWFSSHVPFIFLHDGVLIPFYALIVLGLCKANAVSRMLGWAPLVLLGEASYAFYLIHFLFNDVMHGVFGWPTTILWLLPRFAILIPLSVGLHFAVERPGRKLILRWWSRRWA